MGDADAPPPTRTARKEQKHKYGEYKWVLLTDEEYARLIADLGEDEAKRCIAYVDEAAQRTHNKNGWKDWNLTVRKCSREGWGKSRYGWKNDKPSREEREEKWGKEFKSDYTKLSSLIDKI